MLLTIALSLSAAMLDLRSCQKRIATEITTIEPITMVAFMSSVTKDTAASRVSSRSNGVL